MIDKDSSQGAGGFLALDPDKELEFRRPFTQGVVKQTLKVVNTLSHSGVAFKVKTTAPKQYCVRPNSGRIPPQGSIEVQVLLQTMKEDPPLDMKCKDKFLVQAIRVADEVMQLDADTFATRLSELWSAAEDVKKSDPEGGSDIMAEKKLRCSYLAALPTTGSVANTSPSQPAAVPASPTTPAHSNNNSSQQTAAAVAPPSYSPPTYAASTANSSPKANPTVSNPNPNNNNSNAGNTNATVPNMTNNGSQPPIAAITSDADRELREAKDQIKRLQQAVEGYRSEIERLTSLRQRRGAGGDGGSSTGGGSTALAVQGGVSFQIVALVALIAFILGVLVF
ncbi:hypothetical protein SmJEL517_g02083 [Synchytrium microbalum]|uniref:MSP domain-containing protein n=1 Tax=Synchytrium microbalum TaxID=1806994 RepID=A0A507CC94_9FUNG|nr:uncharacterized protein SmJEL517_g02083 [Synchytrium microbalum]TPX35564.1 hypothetical protein SmJEL517_g02083 [Synchytrium microbalum]